MGAGAQHGASAVSQGVMALRASHHCRANSTGRDPKYLFSGLLVCGQCGGKFVICEATKYGCSTWRTRGDSVCSNTLRVPRTLVETLLLASIQRDLFTEEGLAVFKQEVARLLAEHRRTTEAGPGAGHRAAPGRGAGDRPHNGGDQGRAFSPPQPRRRWNRPKPSGRGCARRCRAPTRGLSR